ncbi:MAG TPA: MBL fold metallo-hydrolase [Dehalococcoidia bacterium]|nr:MBL fold metallo-hydrolase [Dehalococcoidia bacterium]
MSTLEVTLLGTGSPLPSTTRCGGGQVVRGGDALILIDCGWGVARRMQQAAIRTPDLDAVFFTHLHSDHITDFADLLMTGWTGGRTSPLPVYGPAGTRETVEGFQQALKADVGYRIAHHGDKLWSGALACDVHEVAATDDAQVIARIGDLEVSAFLVDHHPVKPAFGFKVARGGRTVVFSGDTVKCDSLVRASKDADILVCEAFNYELMDRRTALLRQMGNAHVASLLDDAKDYHIQPKEAAEVAAEANVKRLVLTHVIPPIDPGADELTEWAAGMGDIYTGPITIGKDLDRYQLD